MTSVGIIGTGFGGIAVAVELLRHGHDDVRLWERADELGGVWRDNVYPGAACDVPSPFYSYSFARSGSWSRRYSGQAEIHAYLKRVAAAEGVAPRVAFNQTVIAATWMPDSHHWQVTFADGHTENVTVLVSAIGQLSNPVIPTIDGADRFAGEIFHAARWKAGFDATGKRVAVVGSAATAVQLVPQLAKQAKALTVFQRSANYIWPKPDTRFPAWYRRMARHERGFFRGLGEAFSRGLDDRSMLGRVHGFVTRTHLRLRVRDPQLRAALTPDYPLGCKRILFSNDYYPALTRPNVSLVTGGIASFDETGVIAGDGSHTAVDAVIFATGFDSQSFLSDIAVTGRDGVALQDAWADGARAHLGITVPGFPNFLLSYGPNTNLGGSSIIVMLEAQARHMRQLLDGMRERGTPIIEPTTEAEAQWDDYVQGELAHTAWSDCNNWYRHPLSGRITSNWPSGSSSYARRIHNLDASQYHWG